MFRVQFIVQIAAVLPLSATYTLLFRSSGRFGKKKKVFSSFSRIGIPAVIGTPAPRRETGWIEPNDKMMSNTTGNVSWRLFMSCRNAVSYAHKDWTLKMILLTSGNL